MMTESSSISELAAQYRDQVKTLIKNKDSPSPEQVLDCLVSRDRIAYLLNEEGPAEPAAARLIDQGDGQLRAVAELISQPEQLKGWRQSFNPPPEAWWWPEPPKLPTPPPGFFDRFNWLWTALALALLAVSLSLIADISSRFLSGDIDAYGILAVIAPTVLALLTTRSVLTQAGQEAIQRILGSFKFIPAKWQEELGFIVSLLLVIGLIIFWYTLPRIARTYNESGLENYSAGQYSSAQADFERALKLNPDLLETRYNLGILYEDLGNLEQAKEQYQLAVQGGKLDAPYNNLARLHILAEDYDQAVPLLLTVEKENLAQDDKVRYDVKKNLGWARLGQERYEEAVVPLDEAIALDAKRAPAYCLKAQVLPGLQADQKQVEEAWLSCIQYADKTNSDEDMWVGMARQYFIDQEIQGAKTGQ
ncbi:MAG: tetratricopeptide repeat protein [Gammaproteobacteria bacterium]|nr:tetratricopeptide repeat protein [Gammaproteobacteria bacterium]